MKIIIIIGVIFLMGYICLFLIAMLRLNKKIMNEWSPMTIKESEEIRDAQILSWESGREIGHFEQGKIIMDLKPEKRSHVPKMENPPPPPPEKEDHFYGGCLYSSKEVSDIADYYFNKLVNDNGNNNN